MSLYFVSITLLYIGSLDFFNDIAEGYAYNGISILQFTGAIYYFQVNYMAYFHDQYYGQDQSFMYIKSKQPRFHNLVYCIILF